jgi:hypothetical protein
MGLRIRKSVKIAPGVRLNIGSKSGSVSVGGKGITYNTKLYGGKKKKKAEGGPSVIGRALYWLFIGWWWWPFRLVCYDLPKFIIKKIRETKKPEA